MASPAVAFTQELVEKRKVVHFTEFRVKFEDFLVNHKHFLNQIVQAHGSLQRSIPSILELYRVLLKSIIADLSDAETILSLQTNSTPRMPVKLITDEDRKHGRNFSSETKNAIALKENLEHSPKCEICHARLHLRSMTIDHKVRKEDGGGESGNAQLTHPYCNSGYKDSCHNALF